MDGRYEVVIRKGGKLVSRVTGENVFLIIESHGQLTQSRFQKDGHSDGTPITELPQYAASASPLSHEMSGKDPDVLRMIAFITMTILDPREKEMLTFLSQGMIQREIALEMHFSPATIKRLMQTAQLKLKARDYVEALSKYLYYKGIVGDIPLPKQEDLISLLSEGEDEKLTPRQTAVVNCAMEGLLNKEIGKQLHISESTVKRERRNIFDKVGVGSMVEVVALIAGTWDRREDENDGGHKKP